MRKWILLFMVVAVPLLIPLAGCVYPGTGTLHIRNEMTACRTITALYLYKHEDLDRGSSIIRSPICPNEYHIELGVAPGDYTIEAEIDNGVETAIVDRTVEEGTYYFVNIYNHYIL
jgi:hypothetical protein